MFSFFPILLYLAASNVKPYLKTDHLMLNKIKETTNGAVWVDVENVRGKSGFGLAHTEALSKTCLWAKHHELQGKVIFVVDHGSMKAGYYLRDNDIAVAFAGPNEKADDIIANGVGLFGKSIVITADGELQSRCRRSAGSDLHIMAPQKFLDDLEEVYLKSEASQLPNADESNQTSNLSLEDKVTLGKLDDEIRIRSQLLDAEIQLGKGKKATNKKRKKLQSKIDKLREQLRLRGPSVLDSVTSLEPSFSLNESPMERKAQDLLLSRWREIQSRSSRREQTGDRIVYAERLRRQILEFDDTITEFSESDKDSTSKLFVEYINFAPHKESTDEISSKAFNDKLQADDTTSLSPSEYSTKERLIESAENGLSIDTLKLVAVSDTHGFESQLLDSANQILPMGDILLHLGDFAVDGPFQGEKKRNFDIWLAKQPHKYKIVIRGNHDPLSCKFDLSGAWYITKPTSIMIGDIKMAMVPYGSGRKLAASGQLPTSCDILASHVPPFKVLDRTYTNKNAGSNFLSRMARSMKNGAPHLWLCGHIHEGRGLKNFRFGHKDTVVINCANANSGRARHIAHDAVVVEMEAKSKKVDVMGLEDKKIDQIPSNSRFFEHSEISCNELLLAVDLGLKSGVALFNQKGKLIRYEQFTFERESMVDRIRTLIHQWESEVNDAVGDENNGSPWKVTHIAIEGGDVSIFNAWSSVAQDLSVLRVSPEEWRSELLLSKEKSSGADCKAAARLIARQVVADYGIMENHSGKFKTDVAEAVVMGLYVSRKLGWISRSPAIRRYSNGNVVVPR